MNNIIIRLIIAGLIITGSLIFVHWVQPRITTQEQTISYEEQKTPLYYNLTEEEPNKTYVYENNKFIEVYLENG